MSVASDHILEEIAPDKDKAHSVPLSSLTGAQRKGIPCTIRPQLASLVKEPPEGDGWLHEIKYDGYRILGIKRKGEVRLISRNGKDWTDRFSQVRKALEELREDGLVTDGEIVVVKADGTSDFQALQNVLKGLASGRLIYYIFDLPHARGFDLTGVPLVQRKEVLRDLLNSVSSGSPLRFSDHMRGKGREVYEKACLHSLEGIVSKWAEAPYRQERTRDWVKVKCMHRQEFVIGGFTKPSGTRTGFGALLVGVHSSSGDLIYSGRVGTGFNEKMLRDLTRELKSRERKTPAFANPPKGADAKGVRWVTPELVAEVEFSEWTGDGRLRQPSFKGLREDKEAEEVVREEAGKDHPASGAGKNPAGDGESVLVSGIRLSNPDRVLYPEQGITKAALADFYAGVEGWILPHLAERPLTVLRCPRGRQEKCFFQKHLSDQLPEPVKGIRIREKKEERTYIMIEDIRGLMALVQLGVLEFHPWGSRADRLEYPDRMIFDMDPGPNITQGQLIEGCRAVRELLGRVDLDCFIKTTGGKGFHVVVPLVRRAGWDEVKAFAGSVAEAMAREHPNRFTAVMSKDKRKGRIFVDYLRNARGATSVAAFSTRARPGAPVSVPLRWDELEEGLKSDAYNVKNLQARLKNLKKDPWPGFFDVRQYITGSRKKKLSR